LCAVKDMYSNKIVGYSIDSRKVRARGQRSGKAIALRSAVGTVCHSDRGSTPRSATASGSPTPAPGPRSGRSVTADNAMAESIIGLFKTEVIRRRGPRRTLDDVEIATLEWVDWFSNRRLFEAIGNCPPAEIEATSSSSWRTSRFPSPIRTTTVTTARFAQASGMCTVTVSSPSIS
jgi:putative transposase